jgi:hypothetical protein
MTKAVKNVFGIIPANQSLNRELLAVFAAAVGGTVSAHILKNHAPLRFEHRNIQDPRGIVLSQPGNTRKYFVREHCFALAADPSLL